MKSAFFTPRWIITTLLVLIAVIVMVRLGFWQLDRLAQRREFNASVQEQINAAPLDLNKNIPLGELTGMEYRPVVVRGTFDPQNEVVLRNQVYNNLPGYHLLTPLRIAGSDLAVLVDRGFIPMIDNKPGDLSVYTWSGEVTVQGFIRLPHVPRYFGVPDPTLAPGQTRLEGWNSVNLPRIQKQMPYTLLPVYVKAAPAVGENADAQTGAAPVYPVASADLPDLSEGPHIGYAIQWFAFAAILALGYPYFVKKQFDEARKPGGGQARVSTIKAVRK